VFFKSLSLHLLPRGDAQPKAMWYGCVQTVGGRTPLSTWTWELISTRVGSRVHCPR